MYTSYNNNPLVSIMIPVYNIENYIEKCLDSVFNQTYNNIEVIIVNDKSTDTSSEKIDHYIKNNKTEKTVIKIDHETNTGLGGARLSAIKVATGKWYMFVDGDDSLELDAVEMLVNKSQEDNADLVVFGYNIIYQNRKLAVPCDYNQDKEDYIKRLLLKTCSASLWNKFYRRELFSENEIWPQKGLNQGEDYAMTPRLVYVAHRISKLDKCLYNYVQSNQNALTKNFKIEHIQQLKTADNILESFFTNTIERKYIELMKIRTVLYMYKIARSSSYHRIKSNYNIKLQSNNILSKQDCFLIWLINNRLNIVIVIVNKLRNIYFKYLKR